MRFESLRETLLKGGVAPRHVRRYLGELSEHLDDLTADQRKLGYDGEDAACRARALLGDDTELAAAMLEQPGMRSWPAQRPWLVFLLLPPVLSAGIGLALYGAIFLLGHGTDNVHYGPLRIGAFPPLRESGLVSFSTMAMTAVQVLAAPTMAALLVLMAQRQRLKPVWPLTGIVLLVLLTPLFVAGVGHNAHFHLGYGLVVPLRWSQMMRHWPVMLSHVLALLPAVWLMRSRSAA